MSASPLRLSSAPYTLPLSYEINTSTTSAAKRSGWRVTLHHAVSGLTGWGEAASWPGFGGTAPLSQATLDALCDPQHPALTALSELPLTHPSEPLSLEALKLACAHVPCREARYALELAALDLSARAAGLPLARHLTNLLAQHLTRPSPALSTSQLAPMSAPTHALIRSLSDAQNALAQGYSALKLKVGVSPLWAEEGLKVAQLRALLDREAPHVELRLDANGAWQSHDALAALIVARAYEVSWVEEPLQPEVLEREGAEAWRHLTQRKIAPIGMDERLCVARDPHNTLLSALEAGVRVVTLKPMFLGGLITTAELAVRAHNAGARLCITHALEGAVGRRGATHLCVALNALGIHTEGGLEGALIGDLLPALKVRSGRVLLTEEAGIGQLPSQLPTHMSQNSQAHLKGEM